MMKRRMVLYSIRESFGYIVHFLSKNALLEKVFYMERKSEKGRTKKHTSPEAIYGNYYDTANHHQSYTANYRNHNMV